MFIDHFGYSEVSDLYLAVMEENVFGFDIPMNYLSVLQEFESDYYLGEQLHYSLLRHLVSTTQN